MSPPFDLYTGRGQPPSGQPVELPAPPVFHREGGRYLSDEGLAEAVNIALAVAQPLLVTGEPGCGKTRLAWSVAEELGLGEPLVFPTRSTSRAQDLLYTYDAVARFHDIQTHSPRAGDAGAYITYRALGQAIVEQQPRVVLIDEIDKAPRDFPNDLLWQLDRMEFEVSELPKADGLKRSPVRPIVIITSNSERQLPPPFLRRCVFHHIKFPDAKRLEEIVAARLGEDGPDRKAIRVAVKRFEQARNLQGLSKKPATGELLTWVAALHRRGISAEALERAPLQQIPLWQALIKDRDDLAILRAAT